MNICGIMVSKEKSTRFPHKNRILFEDNAKLLLKVCGFGNVYMFTDDVEIKNQCAMLGIPIIPKRNNFDDEFTYLEALRYTFFSLPKKYDIIVSVQCDSVNHDVESVERGIELLKSDDHMTEVRAFNEKGKQSGVFIFRAEKLPDRWHHMGMVIDNGKEIHYREELDESN